MGETSSTSERCDAAGHQSSSRVEKKRRFGNQHEFCWYWSTCSKLVPCHPLEAAGGSMDCGGSNISDKAPRHTVTMKGPDLLCISKSLGSNSGPGQAGGWTLGSNGPDQM
ncbi:hypothetical protein AMTRI_Chr03g144670 [Amborella trichopoda]